MRTKTQVIVGSAAAAVLGCGLAASGAGSAPKSAPQSASTNKQTVFNPFTRKTEPPKVPDKKVVKPPPYNPKPCPPRSPSKPPKHEKDKKDKKR